MDEKDTDTSVDESRDRASDSEKEIQSKNDNTESGGGTGKHARRRVTCDLCDASFSRKFTLKRHKESKHGNWVPRKPQLDIRYKQLAEGSAKKEIVVLKKKFACCLCGERFVSKAASIKHMERKHPNESPQNASVPNDSDSEIGGRNVDVSDTEEHIVKSEQQEVKVLMKRFFCNACDAGFTVKSSLLRHYMRRHQSDPETPVKTEPHELEPETPELTRTSLKKREKKLLSESSTAVSSLTSPCKRVKVLLSGTVSSRSKKHEEPKIPDFISTANESDDDTMDYDEREVKEITESDAGFESLVPKIKDLCEQIEALGKQILVLTVDKQRTQWFGSSHGQKFIQENFDFVNKFFTFSKDTTEAESERTSVKLDSNTSGSSEELKKGMARSSHRADIINKVVSKKVAGNEKWDGSDGDILQQTEDDFLDGHSDTDFEDIEAEDADCQYEHTKNENGEDGEDDDKDDKDNNTEGQEENHYVRRPAKSVIKRTNKQFKQTALELEQAEELKIVEHILTKKATKSRSLCYTVPDLDEGKYKCEKCGYNFLWKCHLETHKVKNPNCKPVTEYKSSVNDIVGQPICYKHYLTGVEIQTTIQKILDSQFNKTPKSCEICGNDNIRDYCSLLFHVAVHNQTRAFECNICCEGFVNVKYLSMHMKDHFRKPYECHTCPWRFNSEAKLQRHNDKGCEESTVLGGSEDFVKDKEKGIEKPLFETVMFKCRFCEEEPEHIEGSINESSFSIENAVSGSGSDKASGGIVQNSKPVGEAKEENKSTASFEGITSLRIHLLTAHNLKYDPFACCICEKKSKSFMCYADHLLSVHCGKKFSCPYCRRVFREKDNLYYQHIRSHQDLLNPYMCDFCGETFRKKMHINSHRRIHTGEKPFICEVETCKKAFRSSSALLQHKWVHNPNHFICDFCGRKFKKPSLLNNHRQVHLVDFLYPCIYCPEKYSRLWKYKQHLSRKHPE